MYEIFQMLLNDRGIRPSDVSKSTGVPASTLSDWKNGKSTPKQDKLQTIADYFGVSIDYLMTGKDPEIEDKYGAEVTHLFAKIRIRNGKRKLFSPLFIY